MEIYPVFIMGCQRSGTTMLASQLGMGKYVIAFPEMQYILKLVDKSYRSSVSAEQAFQNLISDFRYIVSGLKVEKNEFLVSYSSDDLSEVIFVIIKSNLQDKSVKSVTWVEHNPQNRDAVIDLSNAFPNAKFIHIYRDPRAIYWSMKSNPRWRIGDPITFSRLWIEAVAKCYLHFTTKKIKTIEVKYEDYVCNPERSLHEICRFLGIDYTSSMLSGGGVKLPTFTKKQHVFTTKPVNKTRLEAWKCHVDVYDEQIINSICFDWMRNYGYLSGNIHKKQLNFIDKIKCKIRSMKAIFISKIVRKYQDNKNTLIKK